MNSVERIKAICKERKIAISKLERDLGFANGYIGQLRKGVLPDDRLLQVSEYLNLSVEYLMTGEQKEKPANDNVDELHLTENEVKLILWLRSLPPEMREAVLNIPTGSGISDNHQA